MSASPLSETRAIIHRTLGSSGETSDSPASTHSPTKLPQPSACTSQRSYGTLHVPKDTLNLSPAELKLYNKRKWGFLRSLHHPRVTSLTPHVSTIFLALAFNKTPSIAIPFYNWLNSWPRWVVWTVLQCTIYTFNQCLLLSAFTYLERSTSEAAIRRKVYKKGYKIQPTRKVSWDQYLRAVPQVMFNLVIMNVLASMAFYPLAMWRGMDATYEGLPSSRKLTGQWILCLLIEDIGFYVIHRSLHESKYLYRKIHKVRITPADVDELCLSLTPLPTYRHSQQHHEFTAPVALAATYAHPLEYLISNLLPIFTATFLCRAHWCVMVLFFHGLMIATHCTHSGYNGG